MVKVTRCHMILLLLLLLGSCENVGHMIIYTFSACSLGNMLRSKSPK